MTDGVHAQVVFYSELDRGGILDHFLYAQIECNLVYWIWFQFYGGSVVDEFQARIENVALACDEAILGPSRRQVG